VEPIVISFIIPAHNEEALIGRALSAIHEAARSLNEPYEIILANDASTDRTGEIALEHGARVVAVNRRQIAATRNAGARAAAGELFFFIDADTLVTERAVRSALRALRQGAVGGGTSAIRFTDGPLPAYARILEPLMPPVFHFLRLAPGCFLFCTRQAFLKARGFDETLYATEEIGFGHRLKAQGRYVMLREVVYTSCRKVRTHTLRDLVRISLRLLWGGQKSLQRREGLEYWYGERQSPPSPKPN
jgi:glycosyltransferase involved in cell wall biosynthesis